MNKNVFQTKEGVKINFTGAVKKQQIVKMVLKTVLLVRVTV